MKAQANETARIWLSHLDGHAANTGGEGGSRRGGEIETAKTRRATSRGTELVTSQTTLAPARLAQEIKLHFPLTQGARPLCNTKRRQAISIFVSLPLQTLVRCLLSCGRARESANPHQVRLNWHAPGERALCRQSIPSALLLRSPHAKRHPRALAAASHHAYPLPAIRANTCLMLVKMNADGVRVPVFCCCTRSCDLLQDARPPVIASEQTTTRDKGPSPLSHIERHIQSA